MSLIGHKYTRGGSKLAIISLHIGPYMALWVLKGVSLWLHKFNYRSPLQSFECGHSTTPTFTFRHIAGILLDYSYRHTFSALRNCVLHLYTKRLWYVHSVTQEALIDDCWHYPIVRLQHCFYDHLQIGKWFKTFHSSLRDFLESVISQKSGPKKERDRKGRGVRVSHIYECVVY